MDKRSISFVFVTLFVLIGQACGQQPMPGAESGGRAAKPVKEAHPKAGWEQDWDKTVTAAKQEGVVSVYSSFGSDQATALREGFLRAYGINIEYVMGREAEIAEKLLRERRNGLYLGDVIIAGTASQVTIFKPHLDPLKPLLVLPEVLDPKVWYEGRHMYVDKEEAYVFASSFYVAVAVVVNTDLVKPGDLKSSADLLDPKWKGKIVANDPTISGAGHKWFVMALKGKGNDFMREFVKQEPVVVRDVRQQTEWVARGKYPVLVGCSPAAVAEFLNVGAPLKYVLLSDIVYASVGKPIALINKAAHPNATKVFINWYLTKEGQTISSKTYLTQSTRVDVPTDHLDPITVRQPGVVYVNGDTEEISLEQEVNLQKAREIFGLK